MRKWNIAGFIVSLVIAAFTIWSFLRDGSGTLLVMPTFLFVFVGVVLVGVDRWIGNTKYGVFLVTLLWIGYLGFVAFGLLSTAGLYGFALGFGHGSGDNKWIAELLMYGYAGTAVLFVGLAISNLVKFFVELFSLPKLEH